MTDHPTRKLGRRKPSNKPALLLADVLTGVTPTHPAAADHIGTNEFGLYKNDTYGDCGPTGVANCVRLVTAGLLGTEVQPSLADVLDLYKRLNPDFDPDHPYDDGTYPGDNGVVLQDMLDELLRNGIGDGKGGVIKPLAFAKVDVSNDDELDAAVSIFGAVLWGVDLETAQQAQTDVGTWDYKRSGEWGGHCVVNGAYEGSYEDVITWAERVRTTLAFRRYQLEEAWVIVWPWNVDHPAFQQGVDLAALAAAYKALTGKTLPVPVPPTPVPPTPTPEPPAPTPEPTPPAPGGGGLGAFFQIGPFSDRTTARLARAAVEHGYEATEAGVEEFLTRRIKYTHIGANA